MKHLKSILIAAYFIVSGIIAVLGSAFSDYANTPFWWSFWEVAQYVSIAAFIGGVIYLYTKKK